MTEYRNGFYQPLRGHDPEIYKTEAAPIEYRGHTIYQRLKGVCWDVVRDGVCIGQYGGKSGATGFVDTLLDGDGEVAAFRRERVAQVLARSCKDSA